MKVGNNQLLPFVYLCTVYLTVNKKDSAASHGVTLDLNIALSSYSNCSMHVRSDLFCAHLCACVYFSVNSCDCVEVVSSDRKCVLVAAAVRLLPVSRQQEFVTSYFVSCTISALQGGQHIHGE